eukprot:3578331-Rhodomonas_salina.1
MAVRHINDRVASLVPEAAELLPANFKLVVDIQDSMAQPSMAVKHAMTWSEEGRHAIIGSYRSAVTAALALAASAAATPVISWGASASSLGDRDTYPTLSRSVVSDAVLAESTIRAISSMGWKQIAIVFVDDAWGRGYAWDAMSSARKNGVEVVIAAGFALGDRSEVAGAVRQVAESGARITVCLAFAADMAVIAAEVDSQGLLSTGHAWIIHRTALKDVVAASDEPDKTLQRLTGWLVGTIDASLGEKGVRFQEVLESEPLNGLNNSVLGGELTEALIKEPCDMFCIAVYDAVWTAAIAMSRMELAED